MSRHGFSRPVLEVERSPVVPHDRWAADRSTGTIGLALTTLPGRFVSPGTGRLALSDAPGAETVFHRAARSAGQAILPGSGIKGAVRTLYELLSASCNPFDFSSGCGKVQACDACSLFGARGFSGRVSFSDAVPSGIPALTREIRWLPVGHDPDREKATEPFRLYDLKPSAAGSTGDKEPARAAREVYLGRFVTRLTFVNATMEELGRLLLCCGLGTKGAVGFPTRLGGVKYEGQGAMQVEVVSLALRVPAREVRSQTEAKEQAELWIATALKSPWAGVFGETYRKLAETLGQGEGQP